MQPIWSILGVGAVLVFACSVALHWDSRRTRQMLFWQLLTPGITWVLYPALQVVGRYEDQSTILAVVCAASPTIVTLLLCLHDAMLGKSSPVSGADSDPAG
jgi:hypothetical protein